MLRSSYAVVTAGGVRCDEVNPYTMESLKIKGLYFAGEVLDLDADTGGYNLQIAFSTGRLAGLLKSDAMRFVGRISGVSGCSATAPRACPLLPRTRGPLALRLRARARSLHAAHAAAGRARALRSATRGGRLRTPCRAAAEPHDPLRSSATFGMNRADAELCVATCAADAGSCAQWRRPLPPRDARSWCWRRTSPPNGWRHAVRSWRGIAPRRWTTVLTCCCSTTGCRSSISGSERGDGRHRQRCGRITVIYRHTYENLYQDG